MVVCENISGYKNFSFLVMNSLEAKRSMSMFNILNCKCIDESLNETEKFGIQDLPNNSPKEWTEVKMVRIGDCRSLELSLPTTFSPNSRVAVVVENIEYLIIDNLDIGAYSGGDTDSNIIRQDAILFMMVWR